MADTNQTALGTVTTQCERRPSVKDRLMERGFRRVLDGFGHGELSLTWPDGRTVRCGVADGQHAPVAVQLHNYRALRQMLLRGEIGFAESYLRGDWSTDDLYGLFDLFMRNEATLAARTSGSWWARLSRVVRHWLNENSLRGSRRNIAFHYDLGNDFYRLWLDPSMSYSSALYRRDCDTLEAAQRRKLDRIAELVSPEPGARVLEIGCGWGALADTLASRHDCDVLGISLSREQLDEASRRYTKRHEASTISPAAGMSGLTFEPRFEYRDYRHVGGRFDHIVSIEMFEAVGMRYWDTYFDRVAALLEQGGSAVLQVITIVEDRFEQYRRTPDFIQRYIFPGGMLPTKTHLGELAAAAGLELESSEWFGASYARTLAEWYERFERSSREVLAQGFDERFLRMWEYYLRYCECGFRRGETDVGLLRLVKR